MVMSIKKKILKNNKVCKVTFEVPKEIGRTARTIHVVGDFNNWDRSASPMKSTKEGKFSTTIDLQTGKDYQFRYLLDEDRWENEKEADKHVLTIYGDSYNSVISL
jgi:1,4-alpha-glucan branching enzyme